jgi:hypothetical protein
MDQPGKRQPSTAEQLRFIKENPTFLPALFGGYAEDIAALDAQAEEDRKSMSSLVELREGTASLSKMLNTSITCEWPDDVALDLGGDEAARLRDKLTELIIEAAAAVMLITQNQRIRA